MPVSGTVERAREVLALTASDPEAAAEAAAAILAAPAPAPLPTLIATTALGQAHLYLGSLDDADRELRRAVVLGRRLEAGADLGRALLARVPLLLQRGRTRAAAGTLREAESLLDDPADTQRATAYRAHLADVAGHPAQAWQGWTDLIAALAAGGRPSDRWATALHNRALVLTRLRRFDDARADLLEAARIFDAAGVADGAHSARVHLGWVAAAEGDIARALALFEDVGGVEGLGRDDPEGLADLCAALMSARLVPEARRTAQQAAAALGDAGLRSSRNRALLYHADACLALDDPVSARRSAQAVLDATRGGAASALRAPARFVVLQCDLAEGMTADVALPQAVQVSRALAKAGWAAEALDARLLAARLAADTGRTAQARRLLDVDVQARRVGPVGLRCRAWYAEALLRLADGDRAGARDAVRRGLGALDAQRAGLGPAELRTAVSGHGENLARLGVRLAVEDGNPEGLLRAAERWRAAALLGRPAAPAHDPDLSAELATLREVTALLRSATEAGADTERLRARQAQLEAKVRRRARVAPSPGGSPSRRGMDVAGLRAALGERVMVEFIAAGDDLLAVALAADRRPRLHRLGRVSDAAHEITSLHLGLRVVAGGGPPAMQAKAPELIRGAAARLDAHLFGAMTGAGALPAGRPLVLVPTGALHAVPWALLPTCRNRPVTAAPSAAVWWRAAASPAREEGPVVLVAGPGLRHADEEIERLAAIHPGAAVLRGRDACVDAVLEALDGARLAHLAAHGTFRADNPLFSSLRMVDGPLTVFDLQRLSRAPEVTVLSACDVGLSDVGAGDEVLGVVAALLGSGGRSLVASVVPIRDALAPDLMTAFHEGLQSGLGVASALAGARSGFDEVTLLGTAGATVFGFG